MKFSHALAVVLVLHILAVGGVFAFNSLKSRHVVPDRAKQTSGEKAAPAPVSETDPAVTTTAAVPPRHEAATAAAAPQKPAGKSQSAETGASTYTVVAGDTLTRIATQHKSSVEAIEQANNLGSTSAIRVGQVLKIPSKPAAGAETTAVKTADVKKEPAVQTGPAVKTGPAPKTVENSATSKPAADPAPAKTAASDKSYTIAKGDNPYSIAKKFKVSYNELIKANNITDPTKLQIGQKLIIP